MWCIEKKNYDDRRIFFGSKHFNDADHNKNDHQQTIDLSLINKSFNNFLFCFVFSSLF